MRVDEESEPHLYLMLYEELAPDPTSLVHPHSTIKAESLTLNQLTG